MKTKISKITFHIAMFVAFMTSINMAAQTHPQIGLVHYNGGYCSESGSIIGQNNNAFGLNSFAGGMNSTAGDKTNPINSQLSFAFGYKAIAAGKFSVAMGNNAMAMKIYSVAIGSYVKANYQRSIAIGCGVSEDNPLQINTKGIVMGVESYYPTFTITAGFDEKTGKIGIGNVTEPQAKLHIKADSYADGEDADILLEPAKSDMCAAVYFKSKNNYVMMRTNADMDFKAERYNFQNGKISLGFINGNLPDANIHIFGLKGEDANIILQPTDNAKNAEILFRSTDNKISVGSDNVMGFTAGGFSFNTQKAMAMNVGSAAITSGEAMAFTAGSYSFTTKQDMNFSASSYSFADGKVGIGCVNNVEGFALAVKGGVVSTEMSVMDVDLWPDFVFSSDYNRMSLYELERYISQNHHLPEIPSAEEVSANGINLGEMNALLLQKVEELTLHVIELQKQIDLQQNEIDELKSR